MLERSNVCISGVQYSDGYCTEVPSAELVRISNSRLDFEKFGVQMVRLSCDQTNPNHFIYKLNICIDIKQFRLGLVWFFEWLWPFKH